MLYTHQWADNTVLFLSKRKMLANSIVSGAHIVGSVIVYAMLDR